MLTEYLYRKPGMDTLAHNWVFYFEHNTGGIPQREDYTLYGETFRLEGAINKILIAGIREGYRAMQDYVRRSEHVATATGGEYVKGMTGMAKHMVYTPYGIAEMRKQIGIIADDECAVIPTCESVCGTDLGQMHEVEAGTFSESRYGTTVGHEMFGIIVGVGKNGKGIVQIGDLVKESENTLIVVSGVGATGHQLALVASSDRFPVVGIEPVFNRSRFAIRNEACSQIFDSAQEVEGFLQEWRKGRTNPNIVVSVMSGDEKAYQGANQLLAMAGRLQFQRKVGIAFGLYGNDKLMPGDPQSRRQKDFVLSRGHIITENGDEWWGIAGRDKEAWKRVFNLYSITPDGRLLNPEFVAKMKRTIRLSSMHSFDGALSLGAKLIHAETSSSELKIAANTIS